MRVTLILLGLMVSVSAFSQDRTGSYPTFGSLRQEVEARKPGIATGYVLGVVRSFQHVATLSMNSTGKGFACLDKTSLVVPNEVIGRLIEHQKRDPTMAESEIHPHLVQIIIVQMKMKAGECK